MRKIVSGVYFEDAYPGVTIGAVALPKGVVMIDAPLRPGDGRAWQKTIREIGGGPNRFLVNLDPHPDRTLGVRIMDSTVLAHETIAEVYIQRPAVFKAQVVESGAAWEKCTGLSGIRWMPPDIVFTERAILHLEGTEVVAEYHPGPEVGASWLILPERKVAFIGDAVPVKQPPFLANADLKAWTDTLDLLLSKSYKEYKLVSGRGGLVGEKQIRDVRRFIKNVERQLERLSKRRSSPQATEKMVERLLATIESPAKYRNYYSQRLRYGLFHYYARHYSSSSK
jgi:glyoxylase-like metal-dependent hydrolase (beta-lactamase superfamily II)